MADTRGEGRVEGRAEERAEWLAWDARRRESEARGEAFDEPVPNSERVASHNSSDSDAVCDLLLGQQLLVAKPDDLCVPAAGI